MYHNHFFFKAVFTLTILLVLGTISANAQGIPPTILHVEIEDYVPGEPLKFQAIVTDEGDINRVILYYREPGMAEYDFVQFYLEYEFYVAEIPAEFLASGTLDYYIYAEDTDGASRTSPEINPEINPYEYSIAPRGEGRPTDIILLSPEPGSSIQQGPELIVVSLFDPDDDTVPGSIRLFVDGDDVTENAQVTQDLITYFPVKEFSVGAHNIEISVRDQAGNLTPKKSFDFTVEEFKPEKVSKIKYNVQTSWETRYDKYTGKEQPRNRPIDHNKPRVKAIADMGWLKTEAEVFYNFYFDENASTEAERRQTLDRFRLKFTTRPLTLTLGDANPRFSELTIKGTRVRGITGDFKYGFFGLSAFYGESKNLINPYSIAEDDSVLVETLITPTDTTYIYSYDIGSPSYQRNAFGTRVSVTAPRNGEGFLNSAEFGFNFLRFKDNTDDSLEFRQDLIALGGYAFADYDSIGLAFYLTGQGLSPSDSTWDDAFDRWASDSTSVYNKLGTPKDNIVMSTTLDFRLFRKTFISFETALSLLIDNQYGNRSDIDDIYDDEAAGLVISSSDQLILDIDKIMKDNFGFTLNNTLQPFGAIQPAFYADIRTPLPYIPTNLRVNYRRVPDSYNSLGNPSVQTDIDAIKVDTRTRLLSNKVTLNLGGETKDDNLFGAKQVSTKNNTFNAGVGLMVPKWPSLNLGYRLIAREGVKDSTETLAGGGDNTFEVIATDNATSTITIATGYQYRADTWQANFNVNGMLMTYADNSNDDYNFDNNSLILSTSISLPYPVSLDLGYGRSVNAPETSTKTIYTIINTRVNYYMLDRKLTPFVSLNLLSGEKISDIYPLISPDTGEYQGNAIDNTKRSLKTGFKWKVQRNFNVSFEMENIDLSDAIESDNSYTENRARFKFEYRF